MNQFFVPSDVIGRKIFRQDLIDLDTAQNPVQVLFMNIVEIVIDDVFNSLGKAFYNIEILGE